MFDYYCVLGGCNNSYNYLQISIELIRQQFNIIQLSKFYIGPSEDINVSDNFINVAIHMESNLPFDKLKINLNNIEKAQIKDLKKIIDIDLLLQIKDGVILFNSHKISHFCHSLITLKDICPNLILSKQSIIEQFKINPKSSLFRKYDFLFEK